MTKLSRRTFIIAGTGALAGGSSAFAAVPPAGVERSLEAAAGAAGDAECVCLIERPGSDGGWLPSARLRRLSELDGPLMKGGDGYWYLRSGERVSFIRSDVSIKVVRIDRRGNTSLKANS